MKSFALLATVFCAAEAARGRVLVRARRIEADGTVASNNGETLHDEEAHEAHLGSLLDSSLKRKGHGHHDHNVNCEGKWSTPSCSNCVTGLQKVFSVSQAKVGNGKDCEAPSGTSVNFPCSCSCDGHWENSVCTSCQSAQDVFRVTRPAANGGADCEAANGATRERKCVCGDCVGEWTMVGNSKSCEDCGARFKYTINTPKTGHGQECPFKSGVEKADCDGYWPHTRESFRCKKENNCKKEEVTFKITTPAMGPGSSSDGGFGRCANEGQTQTVDCDESNDSCDQDCEGGWIDEACDGRCGQIAVDRYRITQPKRGSGKKCIEDDGATKSRECPCAPEDCKGNWDYSEKNANCTPDKCAPVVTGAVAPDSLQYTKKFVVEYEHKGKGMPCEAENGAEKTETCPCGSMQITQGMNGASSATPVLAIALALLVRWR